jgi:hypothetical protein
MFSGKASQISKTAQTSYFLIDNQISWFSYCNNYDLFNAIGAINVANKQSIEQSLFHGS